MGSKFLSSSLLLLSQNSICFCLSFSLVYKKEKGIDAIIISLGKKKLSDLLIQAFDQEEVRRRSEEGMKNEDVDQSVSFPEGNRRDEETR